MDGDPRTCLILTAEFHEVPDSHGSRPAAIGGIFRDQVPAYFHQALSEVESEWADHTQVIEFSEARPFQRSMVSRLPYFMIQWDYKGQRGYGHVIESLQGQYTGRPAGPQTDEPTFEDGDHVGGHGFPKCVFSTTLTWQALCT